jgi:hypothetical protein
VRKTRNKKIPQPGASAEFDERPRNTKQIQIFKDMDDRKARQFHPLAEEAKYTDGKMDQPGKMIGKLPGVPNATARGLNSMQHPYPRFK